MPKPLKPPADAATFLAACKHPLLAELLALREIVRQAAPKLAEGVKWNAPSYHMAGGDDCITFNLSAKDRVRLVFHCGAKVQGTRGKGPLVEVDHGWLQWPADDRAVATFHGMAEVEEAKPALVKLVRAWLAAVAGK